MEITKEVPLAFTIPALQRVKIAELCPLTGRITSVTMHFPAGCNALVHMAFGHGDRWVVPSEVNTFVSLDAATPVFPTNEPVNKNEHLWAEIRNGDALNPHSVSVIATIVGTED